MNKPTRLIAKLVVPAYFVAGFIAGPAIAQEKAQTGKSTNGQFGL
jgi:hypothetical protein